MSLADHALAVDVRLRRARGRVADPRVRAVVAPVLAAIVLVVGWSVSAAWAGSAVYPGPAEALRGLWGDLARPEFRDNLMSTMVLLVVAYVAAVSVGVLSGLALGLSRFWSRAFLPLVHAFNSIPRIVFFPVFLLVLGAGDLSLGGFAFVAGVLPMFLITAEGVTAVSRLHLKLAASLRMGRLALMRVIVVPSIVPALVSGMRVSFGLTFVGLLLAELFAASTGLGAEILSAVGLVRMQNILGQVLLIAAIAVLPTLALRRLETRVTERYAASA